MKKLLEKIEELSELGGTKKDIFFLTVSGLALLVSLFSPWGLPFDAAWIAIILCGAPIVIGAVIGLVTEFDIKADVLVSLALIASVIIGEDFAAGEIAFIMQLGGLMEELTVANARAGIERLADLTPQTARIVTELGEKIVNADEIKAGDLIRVLPGEKIPADGIITSGSTSVNQAVMTGESLPVDKAEGDEVSSGTVNQFGAFDMVAEKASEDSSIQRMIRLVQSADAGKAKIVNLADRWATWIVVIALTASVITYIVTGQILRSVTILVVFCPCAMVLATPTAIMAAIGNATKHGFLVREGDALERLAKVGKITFDKTGTLTYGTPEVVKTVSAGRYSEEEIFRMAASVEQLSEHPLGKAIVKSFKSVNDSLSEVSDFVMIPGKGVSGNVNGKTVVAGNKKMSAEFIKTDMQRCDAGRETENGSTVIYVAIENEYAGYIVLSDSVRDESRTMITEIKNMEIEPVLLTGDNKRAAGFIGNLLGIKKIKSDCLPEDKMNYIRYEKKEGSLVCMIGDGVNDAPALKCSDVGIAMGGIGSDIAVDAADIAIADDEIRELPHLLALSKKMMKTIRLNLTFSMALNVLAIILAITGLMGPVAGALVHNAGSVLVIINSALLLKWKFRKS